MSLRSAWNRLAVYGVRADDPPDERRRLLIANQGALITVASCAAFATGFVLAGRDFYLLSAVNVGVMALSLFSFVLTRTGRRTAAKAAILLPVHGLITLSSLRLGLGAGTQYYFFLLAAVSFLLFGERQRLLRASFASLSSLCCVFVLVLAPAAESLELTPMATEMLDVVSALAVLGTIIFVVELFSGDTVRAETRLAAEHERSERLLLNILPPSISSRLKEDDAAIADGFADVTVLFADLVGFTELSQRLTPAALVAMLNHVFSAFDDLAETLGLEKIKTIGDCYMVASGLPEPRPDHVEAAARMALGIREVLETINREAGYGLRLRIGLNTGPVIAGVIGKRKFIYDLWGDTVNTASRMESSGIAEEIHVTQEVADRLQGKFDLEPRGTIHVKGKGELATYFLRGELPPR